MTRITTIILCAAALFGQVRDTYPRRIFSGTVAEVAALSPPANSIAIVTDGASASDCTVGGGSTRSLCAYSGSAWVSIGGSGGTTYTAGPSGAITISGSTIDVDTAYIPGKLSDNDWEGVNDFSAATRTAPMKVGTSDPGTCTVGDFLYRSDTDTVKKCSATNTWTSLSGGSSSPDPATLYTLEDDFLYWSTSNYAKGDATWWISYGVNSNSGFYEATIADHPGVPKLAVLDTGSHSLYWGGTSSRFSFSATQNWVFLIRPDTVTADYTYRCGISSDPETHPASDEVVIEKATSDTNWFYRTRASGTSSTRTDSTVAVTTGWRALKIRKSGSTWYFSTAATLAGLSSATELSISTNISTSTARPFCYAGVGGSVTGWHGLEVDYIRGQVTVSR